MQKDFCITVQVCELRKFLFHGRQCGDDEAMVFCENLYTILKYGLPPSACGIRKEKFLETYVVDALREAIKPDG